MKSIVLQVPRVKICCIQTIEEANQAIQAGASALGFVGEMPSGPGVISDREIATIIEKVPPPIATFLLTSETSARDIIKHHRRAPTGVIQIVDRLSAEGGGYQEIRDALPGIKLVQVIHVMDEDSIVEAVQVGGNVDAILLDSGTPASKVLGGTGKVHDWSLSRKIRGEVSVPVFLAGGLTSDNVQEAIHRVRPFGVDLCNGVRTDNKLDGNKLANFFNATHSIK